jgi:hypothetical protein
MAAGIANLLVPFHIEVYPKRHNHCHDVEVRSLHEE